MTPLVIGGAVVLAYFILGWVYDRLWRKGLHVDLRFDGENAYEGDKTTLIAVVENNKLLPLPILEIDFHLGRGLRFTDGENSTVSDKLYRRDVFSVGIKQRITRRLALTCAKRGYYTLESIGLSATDLFIKTKYISAVPVFREFYVFPRRVATKRIAIPYNRIMGEVLSRQRLLPDPFAFGGIRDYMLSDPMKDINWKSTARSGKMVVNLHDSSLSQKVTIVLDTYDNGAPLDQELNEESIRIAAQLCERLLATGIALSLFGNGQDVVGKQDLCMRNLKGLGMNELRRSLSRLACTDDNKIYTILQGAEIGNDTLLVLLSKNIGCAPYIEPFGADLIWICPYKGAPPQKPKGKFIFVPWLDESPMY